MFVKRPISLAFIIATLLILIVLAMRVQGGMTVTEMTFVISVVAWLYPARTIRSQVLTMKQRGYVQVARLSGMNSLEVISKELLPNLLPYLVGTFVTSISAAVLAAIAFGVWAEFGTPTELPTLHHRKQYDA